ncbi:2-hydroxychromene-2-carboxylate isomerase [Altererythrobacter sp. MF3-039]|uniref:2-hydroxychromene-2-carboxylate isomerase n=1 Tax=Altererythrobacter sp. MF3-039 TaxID=3252901 RepID=UPI00390C5420
MTKTVELIFDCVSPNAYMVWWPLRELAERQDAQLEVTPVFLGGMHKLTGNAPPFIRDAEIKGKNAYAMIEMQRFIAKHGLDKYTMPPEFPFNSITSQRMLLAVEGSERVALAETILKLVWEDSVLPGDAETFGAALSEAGHDGAALLDATQDPAIKQQLIENTESAVERGAFGIPTMFVDGEIYFGKERLGQIEEQLAG